MICLIIYAGELSAMRALLSRRVTPLFMMRACLMLIRDDYDA